MTGDMRDVVKEVVEESMKEEVLHSLVILVSVFELWRRYVTLISNSTTARTRDQAGG